jgi:hypothetical protein
MIPDTHALAGVPATAAWVWHASPCPVGDLEGVFVRCATGASGSGADGFDYARNWRDWKASGRTRVVPWTWFGPPASTNGSACADVLHQIAPGEPVYVVEIASDPPPEQVLAFARRMHKLAPGARLGFTSYPTRAEAERRGGVPWETCVAAFDFGLPQVYIPRQRDELVRASSPVLADMAGKPIHVAVFPDADAGWAESAQAGITRHLGASAWAIDQASFATWRQQLAALGDDDMPISDADAERIAARVAAKLTLDMQAARSVADSRAIADLKTFVNTKTDELASRIIAVIQEHTGGTDLTDDRLVAAIKRALREGMGP